MADNQNWIIKNIFSVISTAVLIGGFIVGYVRLQDTVENLKFTVVDKEVIRTIAKEIISEKLLVYDKDLLYIQENIKKHDNLIQVLFRKASEGK